MTGNSPNKPHPMAAKAREHVKRLEEEEKKNRAIEEEENKKIKEAEEKEIAAKKAIEDQKLKKKETKQAKITAQKEAGLYKTKNQKLKEKEIEIQRLRPISISVINKSYEDQVDIIDDIVTSTVQFRSPITCIMGHVDTGKTKIMDKLRNTNVQEGEVAGITQQIGATFIPKTNILRKINTNKNISIPGLLMIDTPGHEAFSNLRKRGSTLADIVILVIDLVHGLEQQTIESLNILKESNTKFIIALNKIDRLYGWESVENRSIQDALEANNQLCTCEFDNKLYSIQGQLKEQGINAELYWNNNSIEDTVSMCPLSAITGEGISDLLHLIVTISENNLTEQITVTEQLKCIVMEKTAIDGIGITVDALLISGTLNKGANILIRTNNGLIKTQIRNLLTPPPNCESRVTTSYDINNSLTGAIGFKLVAPNLENILISSDIIVDDNNLEEEDDIYFSSNTIESTRFNLEENGVLVYASSEGSLEALMHHLQLVCIPPVPVSATYVGKVMKKHITKMMISNKLDNKEIKTVLAFDVTVDEDALELANSNNITVLTDGTIYRLFTQYENFRTNVVNERKEIYRPLVVYPCILNILKDKVFHKKGPFIFGVKVTEGTLHINTPLIISGKKLVIGKVISIQNDGKNIEVASKDSEVCIKIEDVSQNNYIYGRHFDFNDTILSHITRESIDTIKTHFKDEITSKDGKLNNTGKLLKLIKERIT
jgi:translation initiation factor aIF-2/yIF-2